MPHHPESQRPFRIEQEVGATAQARPLAGVGLAEWPTRAPNTGYEPKLTNFSSNTDPEHTPIDIPDSHHDLLCPRRRHHDSHQSRRRTPFSRLIVPVGRRPIGVTLGIIWNGGVVRVNVATLNGVAAGSDVRFKPGFSVFVRTIVATLNPSRSPKWDQKKCVRAGAMNRKKGSTEI